MFRKIIYKVAGILLSMGIGLPLLFFFLVYNGFFGKVPGDEEIQNIDNLEATQVYDVQNKLIGKYYLQDRTTVGLDKVPKDLINALIATEDKRFYKHGGLDLRSLARVAVKSVLLQQSSSGGGSTITLQLAKNLFPRKPYNFLYYLINKTREAIIASRIENQYSKDEILSLYINTVSFGEDVYGIEAASQRYFNKSADQLSTGQSATLVGMLKATTSYNPALNPDASLLRRNVVLGLMMNEGYLDSAKTEALITKELEVEYQPRSYNTGAYLMASLRKKLDLFLINYNKTNNVNLNLLTDGLKVYITIDKSMQEYAEASMIENMNALQQLFDKHWRAQDLWKDHSKLLDREIKKIQNGRTPVELQQRRAMLVYGKGTTEIKEMSPIDSIKFYLMQLQAGFVAMNPHSGALKSWVGGINFQFFPYDHIEKRAKRQVGSTFKPFVYAAALENGISPCEYYKAKKVSYEVEDGEWSPSNDNASYEGKYTMEGALSESVNTVAVKVIEDVGIEKTINLAKRMGISSSLPEVPSLALGSASISLIEMVTAYSSFVNGGLSVSPYMIEKIEDNEGKILYQHKKKSGVRVLKEKSSRIITHLLEAAVDDGTGRSIRTRYNLTNAIGGKTGTTQNNADGWFIAITPKLVAGAWVGGIFPEISFPDTRLGQGATMALPIFAGYYSRINKDAAFSSITGASFKPMNEAWARELDCDPFKEDFRFLDWLFGDKSEDGRRKTEEGSSESEEKKGLFKKIGDIFKKKKN